MGWRERESERVRERSESRLSDVRVNWCNTWTFSSSGFQYVVTGSSYLQGFISTCTLRYAVGGSQTLTTDPDNRVAQKIGYFSKVYCRWSPSRIVDYCCACGIGPSGEILPTSSRVCHQQQCGHAQYCTRGCTWISMRARLLHHSFGVPFKFTRKQFDNSNSGMHAKKPTAIHILYVWRLCDRTYVSDSTVLTDSCDCALFHIRDTALLGVCWCLNLSDLLESPHFLILEAANRCQEASACTTCRESHVLVAHACGYLSYSSKGSIIPMISKKLIPWYLVSKRRSGLSVFTQVQVCTKILSGIHE